MKSDAKQISRNAKWGMAQTVVSACVLFSLYKFLLQELGAAKLGLWSLILASTSLAKLGELGFASATLRFVGKYVGAERSNDASEILETAIISISVPFLFLILAAIPLVTIFLPLFIPTEHMAEATLILPIAMFSLWLGVTGGLVQSAVDACGRMDRRNMTLIATSLIYLTSSVLLAPRYGLKGVAFAQAIQAGTTLIMMWVLAKTQLKALPILPWRWRKARFSEIAGFALTMQVGSVAGMFVEPVTKALISRYAGLDFLAYYDMANQVITRTRAVLVSGFQAITPQFAGSSDVSIHRSLFLQSQKKVIDIGIPFITLAMIGLPVLSHIWIGSYTPNFIASGHLLGMTWLLVTSMMPAYFYLTGTGRGIPVAAAQTITLVGTFGLGLIGSTFDNKIGPILGASLSLIFGNIYLYTVSVRSLFQESENNKLPTWVIKKMFIRTTVCLTAVGLNLIATMYATHTWDAGLYSIIIGVIVLGFTLSNYKK